MKAKMLASYQKVDCQMVDCPCWASWQVQVYPLDSEPPQKTAFAVRSFVNAWCLQKNISSWSQWFYVFS